MLAEAVVSLEAMAQPTTDGEIGRYTTREIACEVDSSKFAGGMAAVLQSSFQLNLSEVEPGCKAFILTNLRAPKMYEYLYRTP